MPGIPNSMFIAKQMKKYIVDKLIIDFTFHDLEGNYNFFNISEDMTVHFKCRKILKANSNFIFTDNGQALLKPVSNFIL